MNIPLGDAVGKMTPMLRQYIQYFRRKMGTCVCLGVVQVVFMHACGCSEEDRALEWWLRSLDSYW